MAHDHKMALDHDKNRGGDPSRSRSNMDSAGSIPTKPAAKGICIVVSQLTSEGEIARISTHSASRSCRSLQNHILLWRHGYWHEKGYKVSK